MPLPCRTRVFGSALLVLLFRTGAVWAEDGVLQGVRFLRANVQPEPGGGQSAEIRVIFPTGFAVTKSVSSRRQLAGFPCGRVEVDASLNPVGQIALEPAAVGAATLYATHEQLPILFQTTQIVWNTAAGTFSIRRDGTQHVRTLATDVLTVLTPQLADPSAALRPANDGSLLHPASGAAANVLISSDAEGRAMLTTVRLDIPPGSFLPHFPLGPQISWIQAGALIIADGDVDTAQSILPGAAASTFYWSPNCPAKPVAAGQQATFTPDGGLWHFSPDGGLHAEGSLPAPQAVVWGARAAASFAHTTGDFTRAAALTAGFRLSGADAPAAIDHGPGSLILTGYGSPGNEALQERPQSPGYTEGLADYPGLNFRVGADGAASTTSLIADASVGPYPLVGTSKFYVRLGGVSGLMRAEESAFAALAGGLSLYGFVMPLSGLQLSFLDNANQESALAGTVQVPGVLGNSGFSQPFSRLALKCDGHLGQMTLPSGSTHRLHYWRADFEALSAEFHLKEPPPPVTQAALVFGAEVALPGVVKEPITGGLGFLSNGNLVTGAHGFPGVDSRLKPPSRLTLHGTRSGLDPSAPGFTVQPVSSIYFNNPEIPAAPNPGFVSFAGRVDVPFFQDLEVHVISRATSGATLVRGGWADGSRTFFNDTKFDSENRGFPPLFGDAFALYASGSAYDVRARQNWLGFLNFDLPLAWNPVRREFASNSPQEGDFLVVNTQWAAQKLTPSGADLRFGAQFNGLPRLNLAALVIDEEEAVSEIMQHLPNGPQIVAAAKALEDLLSGRSDALIDSAADAATDAWLDALFTTGGPLHGVSSAAAAEAALAGTEAALQDYLAGMAGTVADTSSVVGNIQAALRKLAVGLEAADMLLAKNPQGKRGAFLTATIGIGGPSAQQTAAQIDNLINVELAATLDSIQSLVQQQRTMLDGVQSVLNSIQTLLEAALLATNAGGLPAKAVAAVQEHFRNASDPAAAYLAELGETTIRKEIKRIIRDQIKASGFVADLQETLRDLLEPIRDDTHLALERIHGVINDVLRSAFSQLANELADQLNLPPVNKAIGAFNGTVELARVEGSARIEGDTLVSARLNADLGMRVPDKIGLKGWLDYKNHRSSQPTPGCAVGVPDGRIEITLGAEAAASIQGNPPVHAMLNGRYAMKSNGEPLALAGLLELNAEIGFDHLTLRNARFEFGFGAGDNYLYAQGKGSVWFIDADVRAFLGRTCNRDLLKRVDPDLNPVLEVIGFPVIDQAHPITGVYWNADGDGSLNRFFGLPNEPLDIRGKGGEGKFAFFNDALVNLAAPPPSARLILGARARRGLTLRLGSVEGSAELVALGGLNPLPLVRIGGFTDIWNTISTQSSLIDGAVTARFTPKFGPFSKDFRFSAKGEWRPGAPPLFGPYWWVNKLDFDL